MRKKKEKTVALVDPRGNKQAFSVSHAERLLDMGSTLNGGWRLDKNSEYHYDEENGLRLKPDKANSAETR